MRTKDFIKSVEELGFEVYVGEHHIRVLSDDKRVACVFTMHNYALNTYSPYKVNYKYKDALFELLVEYAKTPIEERKEPKRYYLRHKWAKTKNGNWLYMALRKRPHISYFTLQGSDEDIFEYQVRFTREEIKEIKEKFDTDLSDFEVIEVEE